MTNTLRNILNTQTNTIDISNLWNDLRKKQYFNAMSELRQELEILANLPNMSESLKAKVDRSLKKITALVSKMADKQ